MELERFQRSLVGKKKKGRAGRPSSAPACVRRHLQAAQRGVPSPRVAGQDAAVPLATLPKGRSRGGRRPTSDLVLLPAVRIEPDPPASGSG